MMVAYSFKAQFAEPILAGTKVQTIRAERLGRSRHARVGEALQLYTGMRTKHCRLVARATAVMVDEVRLNFLTHSRTIEGHMGPDIARSVEDLDRFAVMDGFENWLALVAFWRATHPGVDIFTGVRIFWGETFKA